jgi:hypothetical protein
MKIITDSGIYIDNDDLYSLKEKLGPVIAYAVKAFKDKNANAKVRSHPSNISEEEWNRVLDEIIWAFSYDESDSSDWTLIAEESARARKGYFLFAEYFSDLWI